MHSLSCTVNVHRKLNNILGGNDILKIIWRYFFMRAHEKNFNQFILYFNSRIFFTQNNYTYIYTYIPADNLCNFDTFVFFGNKCNSTTKCQIETRLC